MLARWMLFTSLVAGCSLIGSGKAKLGGSSPSASKKARETTHAPKPASDNGAKAAPSRRSVPVSDSDPPHVTSAIERLDMMEKLIANKDFARYARESRDFNSIFLFHDGWKGEKKRDA